MRRRGRAFDRARVRPARQRPEAVHRFAECIHDTPKPRARRPDDRQARVETNRSTGANPVDRVEGHHQCAVGAKPDDFRAGLSIGPGDDAARTQRERLRRSSRFDQEAIDPADPAFEQARLQQLQLVRQT
jgi:hypothetical protein